MDFNTLIDAIENAGFEARSYSGRGMYGRSCVGIDVDRGTSPFQLAAMLANELVDDAASYEDAQTLTRELAKLRVCTDQMGLGQIVYFPDVAWGEDIANEQEA